MKRHCHAAHFCLALVGLFNAPAYAQQDGPGLEDLTNAMRCTKAYSPEQVLRALQAGGYIGNKPFLVMDGAPVFLVVRPMVINGLHVVFVEGWDYKGDLFKTMPYPNPPPYISITVKGSLREVSNAFVWPQDLPSQDDTQNQTSYELVFDDNVYSQSGHKLPGLENVTCFFAN